MPAQKKKVSITLSARLLDKIDRRAAQVPNGTRSAIVEEWLTQAARRQAERDLDNQIIAYYDAMTDAERAEDEALAAFSARAARELDLDGERAPRRRRRSAW